MLVAALALVLEIAAVDAGPEPAPTKPAVVGAALQEPVLARAVFLVRREACMLVEPDAPSVPAFDFDNMGAVAPRRTEIARCEAASSVSALTRAFAGSLVLTARKERPGPALQPFDVAALDDAALTLTGRRLVLSRAAAIDGDAVGATLQNYDGASLRALFDALYAKPTEVRLGAPLQRLYDASMRDVVARVATDIALVCARPKVLAAESKRVMDAARTGKGATGKDSWRVALNKLVVSDDDAARIDPRLVGFVLRRQADGTLPVVRELLRLVLVDYDPATAAKLAATL